MQFAEFGIVNGMMNTLIMITIAIIIIIIEGRGCSRLSIMTLRRRLLTCKLCCYYIIRNAFYTVAQSDCIAEPMSLI